MMADTSVLNRPLYLVGENITKEEAYRAGREKALRRIAHGVYVPQEREITPEFFQTFGMRLAQKFFPAAVLSHATAWYKRPMDDRIFLGGDYPYKKSISEITSNGDLYEALIVQSLLRPHTDDRRLFEKVTISDPLGKLVFWAPTLELQLLQQMEATKRNPDKHVSEDVLLEMWRLVQEKHGGRLPAWDAIEAVSEISERKNEANRLFKSVVGRSGR